MGAGDELSINYSFTLLKFSQMMNPAPHLPWLVSPSPTADTKKAAHSAALLGSRLALACVAHAGSNPGHGHLQRPF